MTTRELESTIKALEKIINSAVHPDVAIRAVFVELKPIRKQVDKLKELIEQSENLPALDLT